jgi:large subunit ribosomal protein L2
MKAGKAYKPITPSMRSMGRRDFSSLSKIKAEKRLIFGKKQKSGRNNAGKITVRFRGGGHKRKFRIIDFKRSKKNVLAKIISMEYDPNRSSRIALIRYIDGVKKYILAPMGVKINDTLISSEKAEIKIGNNLLIKNIPLGTHIHNVEMKPLKGGQIARSAGNFVQLIAKDGNYGTIRLPSGEVRLVHVNCSATVGQVGNIEHNLFSIGKAGRSRWLGRRPHNRGVSMNPVDHPLGGGEGRSSGGRHPSSPWGWQTKGLRTRNNKRTDKMIIKRRK